MQPENILFCKIIYSYACADLSTYLFMQIKPTTNIASAIITATDVMIMIETSAMEKILAIKTLLYIKFYTWCTQITSNVLR